MNDQVEQSNRITERLPITVQDASLHKLTLAFNLEDVAEVIVRDPNYAFEYLGITVADRDVVSIKDLISKTTSATANGLNDLPPNDKTRLLDDVIATEDQYEDYRAWFELILADVLHARAFDNELMELLRAPTWSAELFAALSMGKLPREIDAKSPPQKGWAAQRQRKLLEQYEQRLRFLTDARSLGDSHPEGLRKVSTPREFIRWSISGNRFDIPGLLRRFVEFPDYASFAASSKATAAPAEPAEEKTQRLSSAQDEIKSLRRICILLLACIAHVPTRPTKLLYPPLRSTEQRSRFVGNVLSVAESLLDEGDIPSGKTVNTHLAKAFAGLNDASRKNWQELQREQT